MLKLNKKFKKKNINLVLFFTLKAKELINKKKFT